MSDKMSLFNKQQKETGRSREQKTHRLTDHQSKNTEPRKAYDSIKREERSKQHR